MPIAFLIPEYFLWHYTTSLRLCLNIVTNFIWFTFQFFSIPVLLKTLFSPWHKIYARYPSGFDPSSIAETFLVNTLMRLVGFVVRTVMIVFGSTLSAVVALVGVVVFLFWLFLPFIAAGLFFAALRFIF